MFSSIYCWLLFIFLLENQNYFQADAEKSEKKKSPKVFLTVTAATNTTIFQEPEIRKVVINYYDAECYRMLRSYPFIALYDHDPEQNPKNPLLVFKPVDCPEGRKDTNFFFPYIEFTTKDLVESKCLKYWVAYLEAGNIVHSNCMRTNPNWMSDMRGEIGKMTVNCLMIPGTHDSALYFKYNKFRDTIFERYIYTQEESIFNQLVYGIRFLDLRVWHEGATLWKSKIQITHDGFHLGLPFLKEVLDDVKKFVTATKEFVILDFHRLLSGLFMRRTLERWQHKEIVEMLKRKFGDLIIDNEYSDMELEALWKMDKRILITYRDDLASPEDNYVTFPFYHWWNESQSVKHLENFLKSNSCRLRIFCTAAVAVLSPTMWTPVVDFTYSRRKVADQVNNLINKWFRDEQLSCSNVVLTDYFLGNNIIQIAIEANKDESRCVFERYPTDFNWEYLLANNEKFNDD